MPSLIRRSRVVIPLVAGCLAMPAMASALPLQSIGGPATAARTGSLVNFNVSLLRGRSSPAAAAGADNESGSGAKPIPAVGTAKSNSSGNGHGGTIAGGGSGSGTGTGTGSPHTPKPVFVDNRAMSRFGVQLTKTPVAAPLISGGQASGSALLDIGLGVLSLAGIAEAIRRRTAAGGLLIS